MSNFFIGKKKYSEIIWPLANPRGLVTPEKNLTVKALISAIRKLRLVMWIKFIQKVVTIVIHNQLKHPLNWGNLKSVKILTTAYRIFAIGRLSILQQLGTICRLLSYSKKVAKLITCSKPPRNLKWQKCASISGLWILNEIFQKKYPENMKKLFEPFGSYLLNNTANPAHFTQIGLDWLCYLAGFFLCMF